MAALWKYDIVVLPAADSKEREERVWELGRAGWELVAALPGDWKSGNTADHAFMTWFVKREATHDIGF
ncbi:MAG: hypothetical protein HMLKMBBP_02194 [Planctomycetes bacterium]|nr:hypothetical protein [Planctomycetota bacterium]